MVGIAVVTASAVQLNRVAVRAASALAKRDGIYLGAIDASDNDALIMLVNDIHTRVERHLG